MPDALLCNSTTAGTTGRYLAPRGDSHTVLAETLPTLTPQSRNALVGQISTNLEKYRRGDEINSVRPAEETQTFEYDRPRFPKSYYPTHEL